MFPCKIAITGGVGCGKSYVCHFIEKLGFPIFYCDNEARRIILENEKVRKDLKALVGKQIYDNHGMLNKTMMRDFICQGKEFAAKIDAIVHPRVGEAFLAWSQKQTTSKVFMECAILYESGFDKYADKVVYVGAPLEIRIERIMQRDGINREKATAIMSLQLSEEEKSKRADFTINNDGMTDLMPQIQPFVED